MPYSLHDEMLTTPQVAEISKFKVSTLRCWKLTWRPGLPADKRKGPMPVKVEGRVFYRRADVMDWLHGPTAAKPR